MKKRFLILAALACLGYYRFGDELRGWRPTNLLDDNGSVALLDWSQLELRDPAKITPPNTDLETINQSVWKVESGAGSGSAFVIHPDGYLLTNRHVATQALEKNRLRLSSMYGATSFEAEVVSLNYCDDLALLKVLDLDGVRLPYLQLTGTPLDPDSNEPISIYGFPQGQYRRGVGMITENLRARITENFGVDHWFNVTAHLGPGSSGGPILNEEMEVIGVSVTADVWGRDQQGIDLYANLDDLQAMLSTSTLNGYGVLYRHGEYGTLEVVEVQAEGLGRRFGLRPGDRIIGINNERVSLRSAGGQLCQNLRADSPSLEIIRAGRRAILSLNENPALSEREFILPTR